MSPARNTRRFPLLYPAVYFLSHFQPSSFLSSVSHTITNHLHALAQRQTDPATLYIDVDGGLLPGYPLQADIATHVARLSLGDVQYGHPINLSLSSHLQPLLPLPLHLPLTLAMQVEGVVERDDKVGAGRGDSRLSVACNGGKWQTKSNDQPLFSPNVITHQDMTIDDRDTIYFTFYSWSVRWSMLWNILVVLTGWRSLKVS